MKSSEIRSRFFNYFKKHNHEQVASSSLIPAQDPTLLFANAGMNQFKDLFLGLEKRSYSRAVTIQKCVRAGGKHNDLDNVGFTKRHLTFFEMMGNFSFGDYFKKEAIQFAWEFLTKEMNLPVEQLHVSIYKTDDESFDIWHSIIGVPENKIHRLGEAENFWSMGDVGPCGPCTEIHLDRGSDPRCPAPQECGPACDCDRFLEIWNVVFMQFDRQANGELKPLTRTGVDTGMGLERLCVVAQNKSSVFETDLFTPLIEKIEQLTGHTYSKQSDELKAAFHVLADHIRCSTMLINDGCAPSNDGRGYVLRKIIRRAALFAQKLTNDQTVFPTLSATVIEHMSAYYPELTVNQQLIFNVLTSEITKFSTNLVRGKAILKDYFAASVHNKIITGTQAFKMYDTYGFPLELVVLIADENGYTVDETGFKNMMEQQQQQSGKKTADPLDTFDIPQTVQTEFTGYQELETSSDIICLIAENKLTDTVSAGQECWVIARKSPYFIVGGGQVPDEGWIICNGIKTKLLEVRYINGRIAARIQAQTTIKVGDTITSVVDAQWRTNAMKNHTGTHLLQAALIELFGNQIKQSGSVVHPDYLRFDFTYHENLSESDIARVENLVNEKIRHNIPVNIEYTTMKDAVKKGALAFFGDKYNPEQVRMVAVDDFSVELCGGTHVPSTGAIGTFKIVEVCALAAGHRRIVAVTGPRAIELFQQTFATVKNISQEFKVQREEVLETVLKQKDLIKNLQTQIKQLKTAAWRSQLPAWQQQIAPVKSIPFAYITVEDIPAADLREISAALQQKQAGFYFVVSKLENRVAFLASLAPELETSLNLKNFATWLKDEHALQGGGSKNTLQGGGDKFDANLGAAIKKYIEHQ